ncbi:hypothetical protein NO1_1205 [Candidatus Termititenax aidoneus]|uniref:Uncharacterized protein n=1 Tax=Termititenax aidoneus TaxID=2218524 RepID=A0A388TDH5_TERA1|nr:hypothetical protein NO1_1205 [Candidatus Termititenax aidoneus]
MSNAVSDSIRKSLNAKHIEEIKVASQDMTATYLSPETLNAAEKKDKD